MMQRKNIAISANNCGRVLAALLLFAFGATAVADTLTWDGGASGNFSTGPWTSDGSHMTPQNGDTLVFGTGGSFTNDIAGLSVAGVSVTATAAVAIEGSAIAVANGGSITKGGSSTLTITAPLSLGTAATPAVNVNVAAGCSLDLRSAISGAANLVYNYGSSYTGTIHFRNDGSDYTGATSIYRGQLQVYSDDAFGATAGATTISFQAKTSYRISFNGITTSENFSFYTYGGYNQNCASSYAVRFWGSNTFNGTWSDSGSGFYYADDNSVVTFNGKANFTGDFYLSMKSSARLHFNGEGSYFKKELFYPANITYGAKCKTVNPLVFSQSGDTTTSWYNGPQTRRFNCENAFLHDPSAPAGIQFKRVGCTADMCGYDQTFSYIDCPSSKSSCTVTSTGNPSTIHLALPGTSAATCYAKFTGQVSLSFEGSRPMSLGNAANTSTGSLSLTNAASVTLLDGFKWDGSSVTVADGSTLTVGGVSLPTETAVAIRDRSDSVRSVVSLNAGVDLSVAGLSINGANMAPGKTYGATGSGADVIDDDHFAGTGVLRVPAGTPLTLTWAGGASGTFSAGPWSGGSGGHVTPIYGDTLVFPVGGVFANDIADLTVAGISVTATEAVTLTGSQIAIANGGAISKSGAGVYTNGVPLSLGTAATPAVNVDVAANCSLVMDASVSGAADVVYNNASASTGTVIFRADGDYAGGTTIRRGTIYVRADNAFGGAAGGTYLTAAGEHLLKVDFSDVTMSEDFVASNNARDVPNNKGNFPIVFNNSNTFNGTWSVSGDGYLWNDTGTVTFNGRVDFAKAHLLSSVGKWNFNGEGSAFANDKVYGATISYGGKCQWTGGLQIGYTEGNVNWIENPVSRRNFNCGNAALRDGADPVGLSFGKANCTADMRGFDQTFSYIGCAAAYASSVVTSAAPSTVHLTLGGSGAVTCHAKFTGRVSLSFEGPRPISLGNTANASTGSLSLTNAAAVTLLDGFKWSGPSVTVADGSTLTVGNATFPETLAVAINDRAASGGNAAASSTIALDADAVAETLTINGKVRSGGLTYGASGSGANVIDNAHFAGTGVLRVLKPCGTFIFLR